MSSVPLSFFLLVAKERFLLVFILYLLLVLVWRLWDLLSLLWKMWKNKQMSPLVQMGNILFLEVGTSWWMCGLCLAGRRLRRWQWTHELCSFGRLQPWWAKYSFGKLGQLGEGVVCVCEEGGCVAGWARGLIVNLVAFSPAWWATYCFWKWTRQLGDGVVCGFLFWLDTRKLFVRSPSVQMGNILFRDVETTWWRCGLSASGGRDVASLAGHTSYVFSGAFSPDGQNIISWSADKLVKVWSWMELCCIITLRIIFNFRK